MAKVRIMLAPSIVMRNAYFEEDLPAYVKDLLTGYKIYPAIEVSQIGKDAAEEAFDLTNNPWRQAEREAKYGRDRSISVGDIVDVDGKMFVCSRDGWEKI